MSGNRTRSRRRAEKKKDSRDDRGSNRSLSQKRSASRKRSASQKRGPIGDTRVGDVRVGAPLKAQKDTRKRDAKSRPPSDRRRIDKAATTGIAESIGVRIVGKEGYTASVAAALQQSLVDTTGGVYRSVPAYYLYTRAAKMLSCLVSDAGNKLVRCLDRTGVGAIALYKEELVPVKNPGDDSAAVLTAYLRGMDITSMDMDSSSRLAFLSATSKSDVADVTAFLNAPAGVQWAVVLARDLDKLRQLLVYFSTQQTMTVYMEICNYGTQDPRRERRPRRTAYLCIVDLKRGQPSGDEKSMNALGGPMTKFAGFLGAEQAKKAAATLNAAEQKTGSRRRRRAELHVFRGKQASDLKRALDEEGDAIPDASLRRYSNNKIVFDAEPVGTHTRASGSAVAGVTTQSDGRDDKRDASKGDRKRDRKRDNKKTQRTEKQKEMGAVGKVAASGIRAQRGRDRPTGGRGGGRGGGDGDTAQPRAQRGLSANRRRDAFDASVIARPAGLV